MEASIYPVILGFDHCYIIRDKGTIMVDGVAPKTAKEFIRAMGEIPISEGLLLDEYGIPGKVLNTPGHSFESASVVLETGGAFVGDLAMNKFPLRISSALPIFAEDLSRLKESWKLLLDEGAKTV